MQATENRTVAFSLPRPIIKNATARFIRLLQFFKGSPIRTASYIFRRRKDGTERPKANGRKSSSAHEPGGSLLSAVAARPADCPDTGPDRIHSHRDGRCRKRRCSCGRYRRPTPSACLRPSRPAPPWCSVPNTGTTPKRSTHEGRKKACCPIRYGKVPCGR